MTNNWIINIGVNGKRIFECINLSVHDLFIFMLMVYDYQRCKLNEKVN
jgi:hypothetical protein